MLHLCACCMHRRKWPGSRLYPGHPIPDSGSSVLSLSTCLTMTSIPISYILYLAMGLELLMALLMLMLLRLLLPMAIVNAN